MTNGARHRHAGDPLAASRGPAGIGAIRDLEDPAAFGDPDRMTSPRYVADGDQDDWGGVHSNGGVNTRPHRS